jgi:hypothetical protein
VADKKMNDRKKWRDEEEEERHKGVADTKKRLGFA